MLAYNPQFSKCQPTHENTFQHTWRQIINADFLAYKQHQSPLHGSDKHPEVGEDQTPQPGVNYIRFHFVTKACVRFPTFTVGPNLAEAPRIFFSLNPDSRLRLSQEGGKEERKRRPSDFHCSARRVCSVQPLVFGWGVQRSYQSPALKRVWCHWGSIITGCRWGCSGWAGSVPTLVWQRSAPAAIFVKKLLDKIKNGSERQKKTESEDLPRKTSFFVCSLVLNGSYVAFHISESAQEAPLAWVSCSIKSKKYNKIQYNKKN